ncbi:MAG: hypothetical protein R2911_15240 [Caldilineaceae bacterium]
MVKDLPTLSGVVYLADAEEVVFNMLVTRAAAAEEEEALDGEEVSAEPEVVGRGKQEEDEE